MSAPQEPMRLVMLGTGTPQSEPDRWGPAVAVTVGPRGYLFDAGAGVTRRMTAAVERGVSALGLDQPVPVFLSHLHSDHTVGLPELLLTPWGVRRREAPLQIFGPPGTRNLVDHIERAFAVDMNARRAWHPLGPTSVATDVVPGVVWDRDGARITAFEVPHGNMGGAPAYGYRLEAAGRVVVFQGDSAPNDELRRQAMGVDALVHGVYHADLLNRDSPNRQMQVAHTSTAELAALATATRPRRLVLYHLLAFGRPYRTLLEDIQARYDGTVLMPDDLDVIDL